MTFEKAKLICKGLRIQAKKSHEVKGGQIPLDYIDSYCLGRLSWIVSNLTNSNKNIRELAKKDVRELVKIGQEEE